MRHMVHPEEGFLFMLCKSCTGQMNQSLADQYFGQYYFRVGLTYIWMLKYTDSQYEDVIG